MIHFTTLRQRLYVWLLLPVAVLLIGLSVAGFYFARDQMKQQWITSALFNLERVAHTIDMRLELPEEAINLINRMPEDLPLDKAGWEKFLAKVPGVVGVKMSWSQAEERGAAQPRPGPGAQRMSRGMGMGRAMRFHTVRIAQVTNPRLDTSAGQPTVTMIFELRDEAGQTMGRLELAILFKYLLQGIEAMSWWQDGAGYLVDETGIVLTSTPGAPVLGPRLGENGDELGLRTLQAILTSKSGAVLGSGTPPERVSGFYRLKRAPWALVLIAPGEKLLWPIMHFLRIYAMAGGAAVLLVLLLIRLVTGRVATSVRKVCQAARLVAQGDYEVKVPEPKTNDEFHRLAESFNTMVEGLKEKDFIRDTFGRYIDQEVARQLMSKPEATRLGGQKRWVAVMMSDVRGFTALCESISPEQTISIINRYLSVLIDVIHSHHGIIVDFLGDAVLVFYDSVDITVEESARRAVCCALDLREATASFNQTMQAEGLLPLETAFGLNAGEVVVGNIGSKTRTKYGIVGGPVNLTSRIQAQAEGGEILVSQSLHDLLAGDLIVTRSFQAELKGVEGKVSLYHVEGLLSCAGQGPMINEPSNNPPCCAGS